jgi:hypothetical protein
MQTRLTPPAAATSSATMLGCLAWCKAARQACCSTLAARSATGLPMCSAHHSRHHHHAPPAQGHPHPDLKHHLLHLLLHSHLHSRHSPPTALAAQIGQQAVRSLFGNQRLSILSTMYLLYIASSGNDAVHAAQPAKLELYIIERQLCHVHQMGSTSLMITIHVSVIDPCSRN